MSLSINQILARMNDFENPDGTHRFVQDYPDISIQNFSYMGFAGTNVLAYKALAKSQSKSGFYKVAINFYGQAPSQEESSLYRFPVDIHEVRWYFPIPSTNSQCAMLCNCRDFEFRWAKWLSAEKALIGPAPVYNRKTLDRPSMNPNHAAGLCKHLWCFINYIKNSDLLTFD